VSAEPSGGLAFAVGEAAKLPAFVRRDLLVSLSYRTAFVGDILGLLSQGLLFYFLGKMVGTNDVPEYGGEPTSYLAFAAIGVAVGVYLQFALTRVAAAIRQEQLQGTLESVLATPTAPGTVQLGLVVFDLLYVPVRTFVFLGAMTLVFDLAFHAAGIAPALVYLLAVTPFVWGLGVLGAAAILVFRRGAGIAALIGGLVALASGAYVPVGILPPWVQSIAEWNPLAIALDGMRSALLAGPDWGDAAADLALIVPCSVIALLVGLAGFRTALRHERVRGTLGIY
jgi:ABC-2 type transport system permease protein